MLLVFSRQSCLSALLATGRSAVCALLFVLLPCVTMPAYGHLPELFGRRYVPEPDAPAAVQPGPPEDRAADRALADSLESALRESEAEQDVYSLGLSDPLAELGLLYARLGNHPAALGKLRRALHLQRINEGLLHPSQLPILRALADSSAAIGDRQSEQLTWRYILRIHAMGRAALSEDALRDSLEYFRRARDNYIDPRGRAVDRLFSQAFHDNQEMLKAQLASSTLNYGRLEAVALSQLYNLYVLLGTDLSSDLSGDAGTAAHDLMRRTQMLAYGKGLDILEVLRERAGQEAVPVRAVLSLRLGNWHQWNGKWQSACEAYAQAWALDDPSVNASAQPTAAQGQSTAGLLRARIAEPAVLPEDPALWQSLQAVDVPVRAVISAEYRVSRRGDVSRLKVSPEGEGSSAFAGRISRMLRDSHLRPAVVDGACTELTVRGRRYRLLD
ncbi:MAG: tetratricopeptide (TPR) repeat protein [Halieaceae bacterium]